MDAMHCQVETAQAILDREADYLISVKDNQPTLHQFLQEKFTDCHEPKAKPPGLIQHITREKSHGRQELRNYYTLIATASDQKVLSCWPGLKSFTMVYRQRTIGEQESTEIAYFISSHAPKVRALAEHIRGHWSIENSQLHVLDVTFAEDASRIRKGSAPEILPPFAACA